jgi:NAD(P)H-hydrate epimerase
VSSDTTKSAQFLHPVLSSEQSKAFEQGLFKGDERLEWKAMNQAGGAIAKQALLDIRESIGDRALLKILVLVGKGHNGGDAVIATRHLLNKFPEASVDLVFPYGLGHLRPLVQRSLDDLQVAHGTRLQFLSLRKAAVPTQLENFLGQDPIDLCLDGLLGMQFLPPVRSPAKELIEWVNQRKDLGCRIAVDVPSGVGDRSDDQPFRADFSYATGIAKAGLFEMNSRPFVGRIRYLDLGFFAGASVDTNRSVVSDDVLGFRRVLRRSNVHKKTFGHVFVVGGSGTMPGAILMTVQAALKSGVGLVTAFVPEAIVAEAAAKIPDAMWVGLPQIPEDGGLALEGLGRIRELSSRATGWVFGPGMGRHPETGTLVDEALSLSDAPVLLDADALLASVFDGRWKNRACVITPHLGEFNRLNDRPLNEPVEESMVEEFANTHQCTVLLKGSPTLVTDGSCLAYSCFGGPVLARGGSGDILSGLIGGRTAIPDTNTFPAVLEGAAWHGWAADRLAREQGQSSAKATDILSFL